MKRVLLRALIAGGSVLVVGYLWGEERAYQRLAPEIGRLMSENDELERRLSRYGK